MSYDLYSRLAQKYGISRDTVKQRCYIFMYDVAIKPTEIEPACDFILQAAAYGWPMGDRNCFAYEAAWFLVNWRDDLRTPKQLQTDWNYSCNNKIVWW